MKTTNHIECRKVSRKSLRNPSGPQFIKLTSSDIQEIVDCAMKSFKLNYENKLLEKT